MIEFKRVTKFRLEHGRKRFILKDASFVIPDQAKVVVLSTEPGDGMMLVKLISGIVPVDSGKISTNSKVSWIVGESVGLVNVLSARQNVKLVCGINGLGRGKCNKIVDMIAKFTGLGTHVDDPISTYKPGMKARLAFALSLALRFDYYLVGSKVSVGTGEYKKRSFEAFLRVVQQSGMILGIPDLKNAKLFCDSALVLSNGEARYYHDLAEGISIFRNLKPEARPRSSRRKSTSTRQTKPVPEIQA